ncbi:MAG TPA: hypothetical protein VFV92_01055 [Candidatus Bathyarchaeia archaeon]|nr:hypothetical protein [Candidatus Bathyarchaeia archaeon]
MAKRSFTSQGLSFVASAAGSAAGSNNFMSLKGGTGTQLIDVLEVFISGMATASTVAAINLARSSTLAVTPTALAAPHSDGGENPSITTLGANAVIPFVAAATGSIPSNTVTDAKLNLALNLFGGIVRWNAAPTQQWQIVGNTAPGGESVMWNSSTGGGSTGSANAHILYEPY